MLWKLQRNGTGQPQLESVDECPLSYEPGKRRVVFFPGDGIHDKTAPETIAGSIKHVEQTIAGAMAEPDNGIEVLLNSYLEPYEDFGARRRHYGRDKDQQSHYGMDGARNVLLPLVLGQTPEGKREALDQLTPEMLKERLSHITLMGHSFGSIAIQDTVNSFAHMLRVTNQWDDRTIDDALKELVSIEVAPIARVDFGKPNNTRFYFLASNDATAAEQIRNGTDHPDQCAPLLEQCGYKAMSRAVRKYGVDASREEIIREVEDEAEKRHKPGRMPRADLEAHPAENYYVVSAPLSDEEVRWLEWRSDGSYVCREITKAQREGMSDVSIAHDWRAFLHGDHKLGEVLINVANNAVQRDTGIGDGHRLMFNSEKTLSQHAARLTRHAQAGQCACGPVPLT